MFRLIFFIFICFNSLAQSTDYTQYVNPFIGTGGHGHTYPGVSAPFGFMQLSPDSRLDGWDGCGGYHYSDSVIYGFSHTHLSGTGVSDLGDILIMPFNGESKWENGKNGGDGYNSGFKHENEIANAGYYSVLLDKHDIEVELTSSAHSGMHRYVYSKNSKKKIIIDLEHRDELIDAEIKFLNDSTYVGKRISKAWAQEQHVYFVVQFSEAPIEVSEKLNNNGLKSKRIFEFGNKSNEIMVKVGISAVDIEGAINNLSAEITSWGFDELKMKCQKEWNNELGKIKIETEDNDKRSVFYTAMYHSFLAPNVFSDVDGRYRGMDQKIHFSKSKHYTIFSLWDTFRGTHPLYTITQRERTLEFINTFLNQYKEGGILPIWELNANYTRCMIGYHAIPVITDAYMNGIQDFDTKLALKAMVYSAEQNHLGLDSYKKNGFISSLDESESVSKTLEYSYDDWCIATFAESLGEQEIADTFYERSLFYRNLYNPESKFMEPKFNGGFKDSFKPDEVTFDYTEANSWQYSLFAPHDIQGLIQLLGGRQELESWLDKMFTSKSETSGRHQVDITGLIGQYAHGNEPSHHMAYLYNFTNNASKGQKYIHQILTELYSNTPDGLSGNEDCGQMSSWYVLSSMGIYSLTPGSKEYAIGSPLFDKASIQLENGNEFTIVANNLSEENFYVKSVSLNGIKINRYSISNEDILNGGTLTFEMSNTPQMNYETIDIVSKAKPNLVVPYLKNSQTSFKKKLKVEVVNPNSVGQIVYQLDDGDVEEYKKRLKLKKSTSIKTWVKNGDLESYKVSSTHKKVNDNWKIILNSKPHNQYQGEYQHELIDQTNGGEDFRTGKWQGFYTKDMDVVVDFKRKKKLSQVSPRFLQDQRSWIWYPSEVIFYHSKNGVDWIEYDNVKNTVPLTESGSLIQELSSHKSLKTRYIRIVAKNFGVCPEWHLGAGNTTFIFSDEIIFK